MAILDKQMTPVLQKFCAPKKVKPIILLGVGLVAVAAGTYTVTNFSVSFYVWLYIITLLLPVIMGMMGKIQMRWVLLWDALLLFPIGLIGMLFFGGALIGAIRGRV